MLLPLEVEPSDIVPLEVVPLEVAPPEVVPLVAAPELGLELWRPVDFLDVDVLPLVSLLVAAPPLLIEVSAPMEEPDCPEPDVVPRLVAPPVYPPLPVDPPLPLVCAAAGSASMSESAPAAVKRVRILWISRALEPPRDNLS